jgi:cyclin-dependent kinase regulatory subunit CKS1
MPVKEIFYSDTYKDDIYEYRHVILPPEQAQSVPRTHLLTETEWRNLGTNKYSRKYLLNFVLYRITNVSWMDSFYAS